MRIVIIGNGISGVTAARHIRKLSDHEIIMISEEGEYFFSRTALMYIYMGHMRKEDTMPYEPYFWKKNRIQLIQDRVTKVDPEKQILSLKKGESLAFDKLILATGSTPRPHPAIPDMSAVKGVSGMYHIQDLEGLEKISSEVKRAVVVGGGLIGIELAEMLHSRGTKVTLLVRENSYWNMVLPPEESNMVTEHIKSHHIDLQCSTEMADFTIENSQIKQVNTNKGEQIPCQYLGMSIGVIANIAFLKDSGIETDRAILVNNNLQTNYKNIYAIGDSAQLKTPNPGRRNIEAVWYTGKMMGEVVAHNVIGESITYDPGIWFNSAKFMDIEYQVYGTVPAKMPEEFDSLYWQHPTLDKSIRIVYKKENEEVIGFNLMGIRYRHEVCERWLKAKNTLSEVLPRLPLANFDPEFSKVFEADLVSQYNKKFGKSLQVKESRGLSNVINYFKSFGNI